MNDLTINTTYISANSERYFYAKSGHVAQVSLTFTVSTAVPSSQGTAVLFTGAPKAKRYTRFLGYKNGTATFIRLSVSANGEIQNAYTNGGIPTGDYEAIVTYITE